MPVMSDINTLKRCFQAKVLTVAVGAAERVGASEVFLGFDGFAL
jgi:hypothetical protein